MTTNTNKINRYINMVILIATGFALAACGGESDAQRIQRLQQQDPGYGVCQLPVGVPQRTVLGNLSDGSTITLQIYPQANGGISAYGELSIPSVEHLFGVDVFNGQVNPGAAPVTGYGYTGPNAAFRTCLSSNEFKGTLEPGGTQDINLTVFGIGGTTIQMGSGVGGVDTYISGDNLMGTIVMKIGNYPQTQFIVTR